MNRSKTIGVFAGIFAIAIGAIILSGDSASSFMVSAIPQSQDKVGMLGHVEYTVLDESGQVKAYIQNDNTVTDMGFDCTALAIFDSADSSGTCNSGTAEFKYIAIGNHTLGAPDGLETTLDVSGGSGCADSTNDGEMARRLVNPTFDSTTVDQTVVELQTASPFTFKAGNATAVKQSGIFNGATTQDSEGRCTSIGTTDMFSIQELAGANGITVSDGDSLSVKWTITISGT
ncbi:MAG: hypothetical protein ACW9XH_02740 [Candidatus Nitrosopumilus sp. bin_32a]